MFDKFTSLNKQFLGKLPKKTIAVKSNPTTNVDPKTGLLTKNYSKTLITSAFMSTWNSTQIANSNGKLTLESLRIILADQVSVDDILTIDNKDYRIDVFEIKQGYFVLGANPL